MTHLESLFRDLYQTNYPKVYRLCLGYMKGNSTQANELCQEVFIKVWENLSSFRQESAISTWVYRITVNTCLLYLRKKKDIPVSKLLNNLESHPEEEENSNAGQRGKKAKSNRKGRNQKAERENLHSCVVNTILREKTRMLEAGVRDNRKNHMKDIE